jgi:hypothetical protein
MKIPIFSIGNPIGKLSTVAACSALGYVYAVPNDVFTKTPCHIASHREDALGPQVAEFCKALKSQPLSMTSP